MCAMVSWRSVAGLLIVACLALLYLTGVYYFVGVNYSQWHVQTAGGNLSVHYAAAGDHKHGPGTLTAAQLTAVAAAAQQPVVIGLRGSGQWPFYQAMAGGEKLKDLGIRAKQSMGGAIMNTRWPDWVSSSGSQFS